MEQTKTCLYEIRILLSFLFNITINNAFLVCDQFALVLFWKSFVCNFNNLCNNNIKMNKERESRLTSDEYEVQFFGFCITEVMDSIKSLVEYHLQTSILSMKSSLETHYKDTPPDALSEVSNKLVELYLNVSKKPLKVLKKEIQECIKIPRHVLLPKDADYQRRQFAVQDFMELDKENDRLAKRAEQVKCMERVLRMELSEYKQIASNVQEKITKLEDLARNLKSMDEVNREFLAEKAVLEKLLTLLE